MTHGRELGLALQTDKRPGDYALLAARAEAGGFDVVTVYNDLWFQPALPALLEDRAGDGAGPRRPLLPEPVHGPPR